MNTANPQDQGLDPQRLTRIADWMQRYVAQRKFPGASILIARDGHEVYFNATGQRDVEAGLRFERDTVARIYSMTKPVTSIAAMMLVERGLFHLDAPVSEFLPVFSDMTALCADATRIDQVEPCATPTIHQLMTHTSGLSYPFNPGLLPAEMDRLDLIFGPDQGLLADRVDQVAGLPLAFQPGRRWEYSVGIDILGRVIEVVSGQSLADFLHQNILDPLGMHQTGFRVPPGTGDRFATLYTPLEGGAMALQAAKPGVQTLRPTDRAGGSAFESATLFSGGGGLVGTIDDYMAFAEMMRLRGKCDAGQLLGPRTVDFMMRNHLRGEIAAMGPQSFAEQPMEGMGFGLGGAVVLDPARARWPGSVGDYSWGGMASTYFWIDREHDLSVVFFTQLAPSSAYPARAELKALVQGAILS
ncbi:serine hydrolase domain-containing protein [Sedimentitalea sp. HM32M-2]|uniref:serine hydrolase domain-containing protein n=1 Tax=Sedimentitalea sp. HM32M-2 TaxID=3351566 RepID=UPI0036275671